MKFKGLYDFFSFGGSRGKKSKNESENCLKSEELQEIVEEIKVEVSVTDKEEDIESQSVNLELKRLASTPKVVSTKIKLEAKKPVVEKKVVSTRTTSVTPQPANTKIIVSNRAGHLNNEVVQEKMKTSAQVKVVQPNKLSKRMSVSNKQVRQPDKKPLLNQAMLNLTQEQQQMQTDVLGEKLLEDRRIIQSTRKMKSKVISSDSSDV